jgi:cysteine desulfuration protein SufE
MTSINDIVDDFDLLESWEERYQYLLELGARLPTMPAGLTSDASKVHACVSQVWVQLVCGSDRERCRLHGHSETPIIKGVVALIVSLCEGKTPSQILETDYDALFNRLALDEHLSPNRHVGIYAIVDKVRLQAKALLGATA